MLVVGFIRGSASHEIALAGRGLPRKIISFLQRHRRQAYGHQTKAAKQIRPMSKESLTIIGLPAPWRRRRARIGTTAAQANLS
jgi:hypothetical protein